ncbi:L-methionine/branched-chain amino acid transporter [Shewanella gelidii]|nr:L-methionine/branched-chain amino acid transporter [Shewanella gelidii]MCL1098519.1 L-methionine/branched-chain amino acid transporter [Shewanella gelidii]
MNQIRGTIGRWQGAGLMATTLLGTGVFILPQITVNKAGVGAVFAWALLTLAIVPVTLVFARLASHFPHAAGPAYFVERAFGRVAGRTIGLIFLLVIPLGSPAAILMTFEFVNALVPMSGWGQVCAELVVIACLLLLNLKGIQVSAKLQFALTLGVVAVVMSLFSAAGIQGAQLSVVTQQELPEFSLVMAAVGIGFWSFLGVEAMTHLANDFKSPARDMVPAMMIGTVLVGLVYMACTLLLLAFPNDANVAMIGAFDQLLGGYGAQVIGILGIASGLATVNVYCASASRLMWSFSQEGILPRYFQQLNRHGVPVRALSTILLVMAIVMVMTYVGGYQLEHLIAWSNGVFVIIYLMSMLAAAKLLPRHNWPLVIVGSIFCLLIGVALGQDMLYAIAVMLIAAPFLWWQKQHIARKQQNAAEPI